MTAMTIDRAVVQQALEALETCDAAHPSDGGQQWYDEKLVEPAISALRAALAQKQEQEQAEPVATFDEVWDAIDWDKWRMEPIRELVRMIHSKTSPKATLAEPAQEDA